MSLLLLILQPQRSYMNALMAELVDALVSKTNEVTLVPVRFRLRVLKLFLLLKLKELFYLLQSISTLKSTPTLFLIFISINLTGIFLLITLI